MKTKFKILLSAIFLGTAVCMGGMLYYLQKQEPVMEEKVQLIQQQQKIQEQLESCRAREASAQTALKEDQERLNGLQARIGEAASYQQALQTQLEACQELFQFDACPFVPDYDIKRFQDSELANNLTDLTIKGLFGSLIGGAVSGGNRENQDSLYSNRGLFNESMTRWIQPAISNFSGAIVVFDGSYEEYQRMSVEQDEQQSILNKMLLEQSGKDWQTNLLTKEKDELLDAMAKYRFHLKVYYDMFSMLLINNTYLSQLQEQLDRIDQILAKYDPDGVKGYTEEEKAELLITAINTYTYAVEQMTSNSKDPAFPTIGGEFGSRKGEIRGYYNANQKKVYIRQELFQGFYDAEGRPIYVKNKDGYKAYFYEGQVVSHDCETEEELQSLIRSANIIYENFDERWIN